MSRVQITVHGVVQGVGFRPFVHRAAEDLGLGGWVRNGDGGVTIEVEGAPGAVERFLERLRDQPPPAARVQAIEVAPVPARDEEGFRILASDARGIEARRPSVPADLATCPECLAEIADPSARRYRYPFTNCTRCGPRYSIVESLPWDRARTTMRSFPLCAECARELDDPEDRRHHAQPIACPRCGPRQRLVDGDGRELARDGGALEAAATAVRDGLVLALQGIGGFQLVCDATSPAAVEALRARKRRPHKPFAVMFGSLDAIRSACAITVEEEATIASPAAPIVLVPRRPGANGLAESVAPGTPRLGVFVPYSPLHRLLLDEVGRPVVCTSGNLSDEPMAIDEAEARERLRGVADLFLAHDRPIARPVDDSVVRVGARGPRVLRRARGFAPLGIPVAEPVPGAVLAVGADLKSAVAVLLPRGSGSELRLSQHLGDLRLVESARLLERTVEDLLRFLDARPVLVACDRHPDYASTRLAERLAAAWRRPLVRVQHHHAHIAAVLAERGIARPALGLAWDGAGLGDDGTLWGGEALVCAGDSFRRVASLRPFALPGGERAMREPRRTALAMAHALGSEELARAVEPMFAGAEAATLRAMIDRGVGSPRTSSVGRLFDAVAALCGLRDRCSYEGQAAIELEAAAGEVRDPRPYALPLVDAGPGSPALADWGPLVADLVADRRAGVPVAILAARFHDALVDLALAMARHAGLADVILAGGCFQNARLARDVRHALEANGFAVHAGAEVPPNDGGVAAGQALVAARRHARECS